MTTEENEKAPLVARDVIGKVLSTPPVRLLAKQYGIDINNIQGTGKDCRVLKEDVLRYVSGEGTGEDLVETSNVVHVQKVDGHGFEDKKIQLRYICYNTLMGMKLNASNKLFLTNLQHIVV